MDLFLYNKILKNQGLKYETKYEVKYKDENISRGD